MTPEQIHTIHKMREPDESGRPKHTQAEVAAELGKSQTWISLKEDELGIRQGFRANRTVEKSETEENETNIQAGNEESEMSEENEEENDEWVCGGCGSHEYYDAGEYADAHIEELNKSQVRMLDKHSKVCVQCGRVE